jgi:DNA-binding CsgD family transcriptional regulator
MEKVVLADQLTEREKQILERLIAGLSDQQVAADLFLSPNTVRWYNRQIYSNLGVGSRTQAIARAQSLHLLEKAAPTSHSPSLKQYLPAQTTPFIGRSRDVVEVIRLLSSQRLLTLTGTGGIGKTRLALRVAAEMAGSFADGVYFLTSRPCLIKRW